jgi:dTMP kinase
MPKNKGLFITFEGTEGAGKSTLIQEVARQLVTGGAKASAIVLTREPGGTQVAEQIRKTLLENPMSPWTELFLYEAARAEHLAETVLPALEKGKIVLCDRFTDSTLAYQAHARGLDWKTVKQLNRIATRGLEPDASFLIDIDPAMGLARAQDKNRFEEEGVRFQTQVRAGFLKSIKQEPHRWAVIKTHVRRRGALESKTPETLGAEVIAVLQRRFAKRLAPLSRTAK